ncbi:MAG: Trifunctional nucleotide phosphoesterase protein YfkN precursor [Pelotomaculum sp. PtaB.Bin104]|nr:MAG: Trifunctional nucleotide phosphoesterase protein YfkN precursor [Pelotomaculum sp. PtaB.Bin104]
MASGSFRSLLFCILGVLLLLLQPIYLPGSRAIGETPGKAMTILFTHDLHDHFLPAKLEQDGVIINYGGYARLKSAIDAEKMKNPAALVLDAGDFSMGTPFQTLFQSDAPELRTMGQMGYDVVTLGNHEYDYRAAGLAGSLNAARQSRDPLPQIVQSNVTYPANPDGSLPPSLEDLKEAARDYGIKEYMLIDRGGFRIGVFGLMGKEAASNAPMSGVKFVDQLENAGRIVKLLKQQENADLIVCLSHSGTWAERSQSEDESLAQKVPEIDVIISGHTHTSLDRPVISGRTIIASSGDSCKNLGVINISQVSDGTWQLESYRLQQIDDRLPEDGHISGIVDHYRQQVQAKYFDRFDLKYDQVLAAAPFSFQPVDQIINQHAEATLGNLISDAYIYAVMQAEGANYVPVDASIVPVGTIRGSFYAGAITAADAFSASSLGTGADQMPGYPLITVYLTGKELKAACEVDASVSPMMRDAQLFMSGVNFNFNPNRLPFNRVVQTSLQRPDGTVEEINDGKLYRVAAGLYSAQMLSVVGEKSHGLLSLVPKTRDGIPITDFEAHIVNDTTGGNNREVKEWLALARYLQSFAQADGVAQVPQYYNETHGRKVVDNSRHLLALISNPNGIALTAYAGVIVLVTLMAIIIKVAVRKKI